MKKPRILSLQALRAFAFLCIFLSHAYSQFTDIGAFGVSVFVILSGFCMMYVYKDKKLSVTFRDRALFMINKLKKLYPLHVISLLVALIFIIISTGISRILFEYLLLDILLVQSWVPLAAFSINGVAWYLSLCVFLYFMFPWIRNKIVAQKRDRKNLIWIAVGIFIVQFWVGYMSSLLAQGGVDVKWTTYIWPVFRLGDFTLGCIMGYLFSVAKRKKSKKQKIIRNTILEFFALAIIFGIEFLLVKKGSSVDVWIRYNLIYTPISVIVVWLFVVGEGLLVKISTNKVMVYIGNISGYAFLMHTIILYNITPMLFKVFSIEAPKKIEVLAALGITIFLSSSYVKIDAFLREKIKICRAVMLKNRK